jgi:hypothetical protein
MKPPVLCPMRTIREGSSRSNFVISGKRKHAVAARRASWLRLASLLALLTGIVFRWTAIFNWPVDTHRHHCAASLLTFQAWYRSGKKYPLVYCEVLTGE